MALVAGIDSSTQSCKVVIRDAETGALFRSGSAPHPAGTEVDPDAWWTALRVAVDRAGGLTDVAALSVAGQQHGMVALDADGAVIRPALLWNDVRSADAAVELTRELGGGDGVAGAAAWAVQVGLVPRASFTVTKLRWLADHEPANAARVAAVALPHDWLTWRLAGGGPGAPQFDLLTTDRSDASGTGYFDAVTNRYRRDLLAAALHCDDARAAAIVLPRVLGPHDVAGHGASDAALGHLLLGPGLGDNAGAALALDLHPGETMLSLGTSGVAGTVALARANDPAGLVAGFADGTGRHLHLAVTLNAARILDATARVLRVELDTLSEMALRADPDAAGLVYVPYLEGERTPDLPTATGTLAGMTLESMTPENLARATVNALLCHMDDALAAIAAQRVTIEGVSLVGGGARSEAVRQIAPAILGVPVTVPAPGEYVADGAARQAAWVLSGAAEPPAWPRPDTRTYAATPRPDLVTAYRTAALRYTQAR